MTLEQAMRLAGEAHPEVRISEQGVAMERNSLDEQSAYAYNPIVSIRSQRRRLADGSRITPDYMVELSQQIEIPGKRASRTAVARAGLDAAQDHALYVRQQRQIDAARAAVRLKFSSQIAASRRQQRHIMLRLLHAVEQGLKAGEKNRLDVNLARASYANAVSGQERSEQLLLTAQRDMDNALGLGDRDSRLQIKIPGLDTGWEPPRNAIQQALSSRPDIRTARDHVRAGEASMRLADLNRLPDPTLKLLEARYSGDHIVGLILQVPIPALNTHTGAYRRTVARLERDKGSMRWRIVKLKREVTTAIGQYQKAVRALVDFRQAHGAMAEGNIRLARTAYEQGEMNLSNLLVYLHESLRSRITRLHLTERVWLSRIRVAEVLGRPKYILQGGKG
ncbi:MAG TPA: TolC family protein [Mariprofundaceae bacterium]|nr:TolC family protein [Mariprofundaceae bacterium]